jgi:hypothetical protein
MSFLRKALFVGTGGASGMVFKANSKKERIAKAEEAQLKILREQAAPEDPPPWIARAEAEALAKSEQAARELRELQAQRAARGPVTYNDGKRVR